MTNALKEIGDWLADLVDTIREALADEAMRRVIAEDLGLPPGNEVPAADLPQDKLDNVAAYRRQATRIRKPSSYCSTTCAPSTRRYAASSPPSA